MNPLAISYSNALLELGEEQKESEKIYQYCKLYKKDFLEFPKYSLILSSPLIKKVQKKALLDDLLKHAPTPLKNLFFLLCDKSETKLLNDIFDHYILSYQNKNNILPVTVVSAIKIPPEPLGILEKILEEKIKKKILLYNKIDPSCIGGLKILTNDVQYDGTIQSRLEKIQALFSESR